MALDAAVGGGLVILLLVCVVVGRLALQWIPGTRYVPLASRAEQVKDWVSEWDTGSFVESSPETIHMHPL
ncbi:hypothetical protein LPJ63_003834 [Coemansia sp. RSA 2711]|nr:hypothetical protein LPJ63_003834 [Coemansia sp. RSA 2711]